ncbi:MAG: FadR family transcriptional regulator [Chelatococcus sp.]|jgi:GntR family transcriptional repressor for pyruvate dehydrogenase complex|uniref:FadR/GntR family transcriptional regulator n=1 Tax=unclassified Chelatococcus TaxID=2638111 RepID=UPI001BD14512|nr:MULTISPECIES: FadR/GntR family transcriptional regulator [unclassified Chelatococcus]MBS7741160.1 FadR family transcriptional regulator [Chelatococcus sp. HY11]MBX3538598.1 FadR family transcriptional regulator [Chelatococcus sp.]MBX3545346.1 FadR family transcriptional regulator [Chelatococcus sp.]CAH1660752.1 FadR family transcriptional regulator [Hyphomicrobiales bacterium]
MTIVSPRDDKEPLGSRPSSFADQVYDQIFRAIISGHFPIHTRLPSEAALCEKFAVSRPVVREAMARLQRDGVVESRKGSGSYVLRIPEEEVGATGDVNWIARYQRFQEFRLTIEGAAATFAAERRSHAEMARIEAAHQNFIAEVRRREIRWESDRLFHLEIAAASGNEFYARSLEGPPMSLSSLLSVSVSVTSARSISRGELVISEHDQIVSAIRMQDAQAARVAMQHHLIQSRRRMLDRSVAP